MIVEISKNNINEISLNIANILNDGGLAIVPTDTVYGIIADAFNSDAIKNIYEIKGRNENKPFLILLNSINDVAKFSDMPIPNNIKKYIPGMITFILPLKDSLKNKLIYLKDTVAIRIVKNELIENIIKHTNSKAIVAPSANPSGIATISDSHNIIKMYKDKVDIIVVDDKDKKNILSSTIYDCINNKILREGSVVLDFIDETNKND